MKNPANYPNKYNIEEQKDNSENSKNMPNERSGFHFEGHIKIFDPETKEVFIDKRNAIQAAGKAIASGYGNLANAANLMGTTRDGSGQGITNYKGDNNSKTISIGPTINKTIKSDLKSDYQPLPTSMGGVGGMRPSVDTMVDYENLPYEFGGSGGLRKPTTLQKVKY